MDLLKLNWINIANEDSEDEDSLNKKNVLLLFTFWIQHKNVLR